MAAFLPAAISAAGNIAGGILARGGNTQTSMQRTQRKLVDNLLASLNGGGQYGSLFSTSEADFNKSFREPAMANFRNRTAPQIQQEYIANGQQRGTGLDDTLTRAGVDLDSLLNQHFAQFQQGAQNRQQNTISGILGMGAGAPNPVSAGGAAMQGAGAYLNSSLFSDQVNQAFQPQTPQTTQPAPNPFQQQVQQRSGFLPEQSVKNYQFQYNPR